MVEFHIGHLEGYTVSILADGEVLPQQVVTGGVITLDKPYAKVTIGLPYYSDLKTLSINVNTATGTLQGIKSKISNVVVRVLKTIGGWIGPNEDSLYDALTITNLERATQVDDIMGYGNGRLFSCDVRLPLGAGYEGGGSFFYRQKDPTPITIASIIPDVTISNPTI